ncbi:MAG: hypothetical protein IIX96_01480 [Clostridia bacterium]|jgi:hypothetical protein|nr:hypothetical protein [Clostridia bacterium]
MSNSELQRAIKNAEASMNMEGLYVSDFCKELCVKLIKQEITFEEYMKRVIEGAFSDIGIDGKAVAFQSAIV